MTITLDDVRRLEDLSTRIHDVLPGFYLSDDGRINFRHTLLPLPLSLRNSSTLESVITAAREALLRLVSVEIEATKQRAIADARATLAVLGAASGEHECKPSEKGITQ